MSVSVCCILRIYFILVSDVHVSLFSGIELYYTTWEQDGELHIDSSARGSTAISQDNYNMWNSRNNIYLNLSDVSSGIDLEGSNEWNLQYDIIVTNGIAGQIVDCEISSNDVSVISGYPLGLDYSASTNTYQLTCIDSIVYFNNKLSLTINVYVRALLSSGYQQLTTA